MRAWCIAAALVAAVAASSGAAGEAPAPAAPEQLPRPSRDVLEQLERSEREAAAPVEGLPDVTWADLLRDPDDLELNLAYARRQLALGELKGASATLERILLLAPDQPRVRLLYGLVLYRLGEHGGAARELEAALAGGLDEGERNEAERALAAIAEAARDTHGLLTLAGGFRYDDNRNQAPLGGTRLFLDIPIEAGPEQADTAVVTLARARIAHRLASQAGHELFAEATYYAADQLQQNDLDLRLFAAEAGMSLYFGPFALTPLARAELLQLSRQNYLTALGGDLRLSWQALPSLEPFLEAALDDENFDDVRAAPSGEERTGPRWRLGAGFRWQAAPRVGLELSAARATKNAREDYEGYQAMELTLSPTLLLGEGQFLRGDFTARHRGYFGPDRFVSDQARREVDWIARLTYGAPLSLFARPLPALARYLEEVQILIALEQQRTVSNISNYDYLSRRAQVLLTRSIRF